MRAIEFRFYDPFNEVMVYNHQFQMLSDFFIEHDKALYGDNNPVLMQYTGLKDAKGNKVFEGDVLSSHMGNLVVTFTNGKFIAEMKDKQPGKWDYHIEGRLFYQVDVIGNIYEELNEQKTANIGTDRDG